MVFVSLENEKALIGKVVKGRCGGGELVADGRENTAVELETRGWQKHQVNNFFFF